MHGKLGEAAADGEGRGEQTVRRDRPTGEREGEAAARLLALAEPEGRQAAVDDAHLPLEVPRAQGIDPVHDVLEGWGPEHAGDDRAVLKPDIPGAGPDPEDRD